MAGRQLVFSLIYSLHVFLFVCGFSNLWPPHAIEAFSRARIPGHASPGAIPGHTGPGTKEKPYKGEAMPPPSGGNVDCLHHILSLASKRQPCPVGYCPLRPCTHAHLPSMSSFCVPTDTFWGHPLHAPWRVRFRLRASRASAFGMLRPQGSGMSRWVVFGVYTSRLRPFMMLT